MIGTLLTLGFLAVALFALAALGTSLAQGLAAAGRLRHELAACEDVRYLKIRSASTSAVLTAGRRFTPERGPRRVGRLPQPRLRHASRVAA